MWKCGMYQFNCTHSIDDFGYQHGRISNQASREAIMSGSLDLPRAKNCINGCSSNSSWKFCTNSSRPLQWPDISSKQSKLVEPVKELDIFLGELVAALPVDIMPGSSDPANFSLHQQASDRAFSTDEDQDGEEDEQNGERRMNRMERMYMEAISRWRGWREIMT